MEILLAFIGGVVLGAGVALLERTGGRSGDSRPQGGKLMLADRRRIWTGLVVAGLMAALVGCADRQGAAATPTAQSRPLFAPSVTSIDIKGITCPPPCPPYAAGRMMQAAAGSLRQLGWRVSVPPVGPDGRVLGGHEVGQGKDLVVLAGTMRMATRAQGAGAAGVSRLVELTLSVTVKGSLSDQAQGAFVVTRQEALAGDAAGLPEEVILRLIRSAASELAGEIGPPPGRAVRSR